MANDCVGIMSRCINSTTVSTSSSDATEREVLNLPSNMAARGVQDGSGLCSATETIPFSAISSNLEMQFARDQALPSKKISEPQLQNTPVFDEGGSSQVGREPVQGRVFSMDDGNGEDFVDQLVERNLTLSSQEDLFIDDYVNSELHERLDMGFISTANHVMTSGQTESDSGEQKGNGDEQQLKADGSSLSPSGDSFEIFPSAKSTDFEEGTLSFFDNDGWDDRHDTATTEGLMAGLLLHPGCRVEGGAELLTGSLEEEI